MTFNTILVLTLMSSQLFLSGLGQEGVFVTCEFDLVDLNPAILEFLPDECKTADRGDPNLRQSMKDESLKFKEFIAELGKKEKWNEQSEVEGIESLVLDFDLRTQVYDGVPNLNCTGTSANTYDFIACTIRQRDAMIEAINGIV